MVRVVFPDGEQHHLEGEQGMESVVRVVYSGRQELHTDDQWDSEWDASVVRLDDGDDDTETRSNGESGSERLARLVFSNGVVMVMVVLARMMTGVGVVAVGRRAC